MSLGTRAALEIPVLRFGPHPCSGATPLVPPLLHCPRAGDTRTSPGTSPSAAPGLPLHSAGHNGAPSVSSPLTGHPHVPPFPGHPQCHPTPWAHPRRWHLPRARVSSVLQPLMPLELPDHPPWPCWGSGGAQGGLGRAEAPPVAGSLLPRPRRHRRRAPLLQALPQCGAAPGARSDAAAPSPPPPTPCPARVPPASLWL